MLIHVAGMWEDTSTKKRKGVRTHTKEGAAVCIQEYVLHNSKLLSWENTAMRYPPDVSVTSFTQNY